MKARSVELDVWGWAGVIVVGGPFQRFGAFLNGHIQETPVVFGSGSLNGYAHLVQGKPWALWVRSLRDASVVAHEALHVTCGVLASRGIKLSVESEEAYTYTMQQVVRAAYEKKGWKRV